MGGGGGSGQAAAAAGPLLRLQQEAELDRQATLVEQVDADASAESRINAEMSGVLLQRLAAARQAGERLLGVLQVGGAGGAQGRCNPSPRCLKRGCPCPDSAWTCYAG